MIPVDLQEEPPDFHENVRRRGRTWLASHGVEPDAPPPDPSALPPYWRRSNRQLWDAYSGVCAYLAIYFEWCTGAASTDHFVAKSRNAGDAYEWRNYRLSCLAANRNKGRFDDILDPIGLEPNTFILDLATGRIRANPSLDDELRIGAERTIARLKLDSPEHNEMRAKRFARYVDGGDVQTLREWSPFVWYEARRQNLL
ncbi:MAG: hypothetical protein F4X11_11725 [Acidobacteria bacterium]|nr:hypothetical protein [Acidobacteriota bacterium]